MLERSSQQLVAPAAAYCAHKPKGRVHHESYCCSSQRLSPPLRVIAVVVGEVTFHKGKIVLDIVIAVVVGEVTFHKLSLIHISEPTRPRLI
eukprot:6322932-Amphidinium_carterae.1